jgi:hypothetical protein
MLEESSTYQLIMSRGEARGVVQGVRRTILRQARAKFGEPNEAEAGALEAITDLARLEALSDRLLVVSSWQDLLATS